MLEKLVNIGEKHYGFNLVKLKDIDKSCCRDIDKSFYDFDKIKERVVSLHDLQTLSSCDALNIDNQKQSLDFIEMKGLLQFLTNAKNEKNVDKQVEKFDFKKKIEDSIYLLYTIINSKNFSATKQERNDLNIVKKRYFIVTDISLEKNPLELFSMTLDYLSNYSNIDDYLILKLNDKINHIEYSTEIEKPKLINCDEIRFI